MPESLTRLQQQAIELWNAMDKSQKTKMLVIALAVIVSVSLAIFIITKPSYENLLSGNVDATELTAIRKVLADNNINFKMADGNTNIQVTAKDLETAQLALADKGYPKEGTTFSDALSSIKLSTTESDKKQIFKQYTEQKIARGLKAISSISDAVVNLSIPDNQFYLDDTKQQDVTAAVVVQANETLSKSQIAGIENFVAGSVEGLKKKNVMIIDKDTGETLNEPGESDIAVSTTKQYEYQQQINKKTEDTVKSLFNNMFDNIRVGANIICDFDSQTTKAVKYTPVVGDDSGILRSTQVNKEQVQNASSGGTPGTDSNSTTTYTTTNGGNSSYDNTSTTANYEINQENTESVKAVGQPNFEKSSITVSLLYGTVRANAPTQAELDTYTKMISNATGIPNTNITIASFKLPAVNAVAKKTDWMQLLGQIGPISALAILIILLAIGLLRRGTGTSEPLLGALNYNKSMPAAPTIDVAVGDDLPEIELEEKSEVKKQIDKFVKRKPDAVAQLLRNWLSDDWN